MIACPICGRETSVTETRKVGVGARRRRKCIDLECPGKLTTVEISVSEFHRAADLADGRAILVSRKLIKQLQRAVNALGVKGAE